jgi:ABC-type phosphate transport system substrate-binding protein
VCVRWGFQDFIVLDKAVSPEESPLYNNLIQFPLVAQAQVVIYSLPELASDPNLVHIYTKPSHALSPFPHLLL